MTRILSLAFVLVSATAVQLGAQTDRQTIDNQVADIREYFLDGDFDTGFALMLPLADAGHPRAQNLIATAYQYGNGVPFDAAAALRYFELSRAQGYPPAIHNLGVLYEFGMPGLDIDPTRARAYFALAAAHDYAPSISAHGGYLVNGTAGAADVVNAIRLFRRGAELGDRISHEWLGYVYAAGIGVSQDLEMSRHHYVIAAMLGLDSAQNHVGTMFEFGDGGAVDLDRAMEFYHMAIRQDLGDAGINAAWMIFENPDVFPAQIDGLALCYWGVMNALPERAEEARVACDEMAVSFAATEQRQARKAAAAL